MSLSALQTDAFIAVARAGSFSEAATRLHLTQSALSQRVMQLEREIKQTLFIRKKSGVLLTETGRRLLKFCQVKNSLEEELLEELQGKGSDEVAGRLRLAAYSSVMRSLILPTLQPLLKEHTKVQAEFIVRNTNLSDLLQRGEVDFIIVDHPYSAYGVENVKLGEEIYVIVEATNYAGPSDLYLDNDPSDLATELFFRAQGAQPPPYRRAFFSDVYGILDAVIAGIGRAVVPRHLVKDSMPIRILRRYKPLPVEFTLHFHNQPFYTDLHSQVVERLKSRVPKFLQRGV